MPIAGMLVIGVAVASAVVALLAVTLRAVRDWRRAERDIAARRARILDAQGRG